MTSIIIGLSFLGFLISVYFTLVYQKIISPEVSWIPSFCRLDERSCGSILATPEAKLFRLPNFYFGLAYYTVLIVFSFFPLLFKEFLFELRIVAGFTVFIGIVLTYALLFRIRIRCVLCFMGHVVNLALFLVFLFFP